MRINLYYELVSYGPSLTTEFVDLARFNCIIVLINVRNIMYCMCRNINLNMEIRIRSK